MLNMAKHQGYVTKDCTLHGVIVMSEVNVGKNPCKGCQLPRVDCGSLVAYTEGEL